ncbi:MAG: helix-hairpin-helix domain-containing protein [Prevotellaceae bacterium]|jgi:competence ComEA-like helix-hairpin-helix protein|nr:helix-hairpin-helix domain-containing protein [Prevotellaceae bacterium]
MPKNSRQKSPSGFLLFLKEYFSFFNSERLGIAALIIILMVVIFLPRFFRNDEFTGEDLERLKKEMDIFLAEMERNTVRNKPDTLFMFDPNTVDSASLTLLGFSPRQAKSIVNYRNKGGRFYNRESFGNSFVVSEEMFARLYYYIDIKRETKKIAERTGETGARKKDVETIETKEKKESNTAAKKPYTVELNTADITELQKFYGIGEYYAKKIVEYRDRLGGFCKAEQLMEIKGIDSVRFAMFRNQILIDTAHVRRIKINAVTEKELAKHPYINNFVAKSIISYRKFKGTIASGSEMVKEKVITEEQLKKTAGYIEY